MIYGTEDEGLLCDRPLSEVLRFAVSRSFLEDMRAELDPVNHAPTEPAPPPSGNGYAEGVESSP